MCGCGTLPPEYSAAPTRSLVRGVTLKDTSVQIRAVDGGHPLWIRNHHIGDRVWLEPGVHKVSVVCSTEDKCALFSVNTDIEMDVQPGYKYSLIAWPFHGAGAQYVDITKIECKPIGVVRLTNTVEVKDN